MSAAAERGTPGPPASSYDNVGTSHATAGTSYATGGTSERGAGTSYAAAGVDIDAGEEAVKRIKSLVASTSRPEVLGGIGGFGGLFSFPQGNYERPVLVSSTDGVGTKSYVAAALGTFSTIGIDLVAMCVDDLVCTGAEPLFLLDYLAVTRLDPVMAEQVVSGVAEGCRQAGCALIGGEMAEHPAPPGTPDSDVSADPAVSARPHFDLAGFAVGVVEESKILRPELVVDGDELVGIASPGLRCNGYSLARHVLLDLARRSLDEPAWDGAALSLGEELLLPSVVYAPAACALLESVEVHGLAHVTGGGIPGNLPRALPAHLGARVERSTWRVPPIFSEIQSAGGVADAEMARVFNLGVGMVAVVPGGTGARAVEVLEGAGREGWVIGRVTSSVSGVAFS